MKKNLTYKILKFFSDLFSQIIKDKRQFLVYSLLSLVLLFFMTRYKPIFITLILILLGGFSMLYIRFFNFSHYIGFELCTMATVLTALAYGPIFSFMTGFVSITLGFIISGYFKPTYFISILTMPLLGLLIPIFSHLPLWQIGLIFTVLYDLIILPLYVIMGSRIHSTVIFFITHIILNLWIFTTIAPVIYRVIN